MNPLRWSFRAAFAFAAFLCAAFLGFAWYAQFRLNLEPCPLCILQRVMVIVLFIVFLAAALHAPGPRGRRAWGTLGCMAALVGGAIAARHVWLQHLPADKVPDCGPGLDYMLDAFPISKALRMVFTGSGECAKVDWQFLGLSMPEWTLAWFAIFALGSLWYGYRRYAA
ncbi:MAG: disulfide bond formation protein B [Xanthomonadales bacterium]|nr:disulfide bond formation protein B [Xanthomonadales bacterium]